MFSGIVEEVGRVTFVDPCQLRLRALKVAKDLSPGDSLAVNGVCLTVTHVSRGVLSFDIMEETLNRTNLGALSRGDPVNLERALALGAGIGGHLVQGHVDASGVVLSVTPVAQDLLFRFEAPASLMHYVIAKGFIAVDGISLTVVDREPSSFTVSVVKYTRDHTNLGSRSPGDLANLEVDMVAKYLEQWLLEGGKGSFLETLRERSLNPKGW